MSRPTEGQFGKMPSTFALRARARLGELSYSLFGKNCESM